MLEARGLTKCYASIPAVSSVNFTVRPGEILGYLGPNVQNSFCLCISCLEAECHGHCSALRSRAVGIRFHTAWNGARFVAEEHMVSLGAGSSAAGCAARVAQVAPRR